MNTNQNTNQEQKKHFLTSHKSIRFTAALCAAATLAGGVAYAATPDTAAAAPEKTLVSEAADSTFTDIIMTTYDAQDPSSSDLIRLRTAMDETAISLVVIHNKMDAAMEMQNHIPSGWPVDSRIVSTEFNPTADPSISDGRKHEGMDISTKSQIIPIYATASGTVVTANYDSGYGNQVIIDHGNGFTTLYAHCNELFVTAGDEVKKGDVIATTGNTGWSTGIHCHYEIQLNGVYQNPRDYLA
ncbi:MAG: M23 family metallopeptidase [Anaerotignum sp.]|nr:M23 family metallopeptidase [Anaerotignum sp.]MBO5330404.1 M23 family metallopeptidase [Anaerotignum sp.]